MSKYKVLDPLDHDGKRHEPGETVELPAEDAGPLVELGVLAEVKPAAKSAGRARKATTRKG